jgi:hypothetical protein
VTCELPPPGWWCSREPGHEGPCAARESTCWICGRALHGYGAIYYTIRDENDVERPAHLLCVRRPQ